MPARNVNRQVVKFLLMLLCLTLIMVAHLSCSVIGIEQNKATPAGVNDNQTVLSILDVLDVQNPRILGSISLSSFCNKNNNVILSNK